MPRRRRAALALRVCRCLSSSPARMPAVGFRSCGSEVERAKAQCSIAIDIVPLVEGGDLLLGCYPKASSCSSREEVH